MADPYYDQTVLFLPFEDRGEIPGVYLLGDYSKYGISLSSSNGILSTTAKFGTYGFYSNGFLSESTGIVLTPISQRLAMGTDDFTVEMWYRSTNQGTANATILDVGRDLATTAWALYLSSVNKLTFVNGAGTVIAVGNTTLGTNTWYHLAMTRASGNISLWVNGVLDNTPVSHNISLTASDVCLSMSARGVGYASGYYSYADELRVTKGVARYTSNFTPAQIPLTDYPISKPFTPRNLPTCSGARIDYKDTYFGSQSFSTAGSISGIVKNGSVPVQRRVRLYDSVTGNFVREVWAGLDGTFVFKGLDKNKRFTITSHDHLTGYNDVIAAMATPV